MDFHYYYITENWLTSTNLGPSFPKGRSISCFSWSALIDGNNYIHLSITQQQQKKGIQYKQLHNYHPDFKLCFLIRNKNKKRRTPVPFGTSLMSESSGMQIWNQRSEI